MSGWLGSERVDLDACDSTNDEAAALARRGAAHGTVVVAAQQRRGRGRQGRAWHSPPGAGLYLSMVLRPALEPARVPPITLATGIGVHAAVNSRGVDASLGWPNDLYAAGGKKLAGILTEMATRENRLEHVIVGIGVNLAHETFPPELADIATSIRIESGRDVDRAAFVAELLRAVEGWLDRFFDGGVRAITDEWIARADLGGRVRAGGPEGAIEGRADGLDDDGALVIVDDRGGRHRIVAGDVVRV